MFPFKVERKKEMEWLSRISMYQFPLHEKQNPSRNLVSHLNFNHTSYNQVGWAAAAGREAWNVFFFPASISETVKRKGHECQVRQLTVLVTFRKSYTKW